MMSEYCENGAEVQCNMWWKALPENGARNYKRPICQPQKVQQWLLKGIHSSLSKITKATSTN